MKIKAIIFGIYVLSCIRGMTDETRGNYIIQNGNKGLVVSNMPVAKVSEPITNSFVYIDGEYIPSPYIVSISNLAVCINGKVVRDFEPWVAKRESYSRRVGITPETVARSVNYTYESYVKRLNHGISPKIIQGFELKSTGVYNDDGGAFALVEKARKAIRGDEQSKRELIEEMGFANSMSKVRPDWIQRLANNTNLEIRATRILEAKRLKEQKEKERREQQNPQDKR